jgi:hypothetical protein
MRRTRLVDCNPRWGLVCGDDETRFATSYLTFECPEGHPNCEHSIPFTPSLEGEHQAVRQLNGAQWERRGETFETLTLTPSIARRPVAGHDTCAMHVNLTNGAFEFHGDSK